MSTFDTAPVREWLALRDRAARLEEEMEAAKEERDALGARIIELLAEAGLPSIPIEVDGVKYNVHPTMTLRPKRVDGVEMKDVVDALRESGLGHLVYETFNTNTLGAWAREELAEGRALPLPLAERITFYEDRKLGCAKSTSRESRSSQAARTLRSQNQG